MYWYKPKHPAVSTKGGKMWGKKAESSDISCVWVWTIGRLWEKVSQSDSDVMRLIGIVSLMHIRPQSFLTSTAEIINISENFIFIALQHYMRKVASCSGFKPKHWAFSVWSLNFLPIYICRLDQPETLHCLWMCLSVLWWTDYLSRDACGIRPISSHDLKKKKSSVKDNCTGIFCTWFTDLLFNSPPDKLILILGFHRNTHPTFDTFHCVLITSSWL